MGLGDLEGLALLAVEQLEDVEPGRAAQQLGRHLADGHGTRCVYKSDVALNRF